MKSRGSFLLSGLLALLPFSASAQGIVTVQGDALKPGQVLLADKTRLSDVVRAAQVNAESYWFGATWLHQPLVPEQNRLKAGVLFDLQSLRNEALAQQQPERAKLASALLRKVESLPVTGRRIAILDPVRIEVERKHNNYVSAGDRLIYPQRPSTVHVVGAVEQDCELPHQPLQDAREYLQLCPVHNEADGDYLWVIQPDGHAYKRSIALWNRDEDFSPAPGARLYVPIKTSGTTPQLNQELAQFLATQPLDEVAP
ncbi:capsule biosynthesis GfcC family protein [Pseudomonas fluorescens]|uniref:Uncharacterized protein n=1 Tax=Pseudomonas fluorescens TaxID=294 RepID=A0A5E7VT31_PSEFL|nr:capsule biosynthesis GfcC family protein [Pseudomonas fluorescens]VVQ26029.1 hypothetical protein PS928_06320 [Pseudomonas fluorescens]